MLSTQELILRLVLSAIIGGLIGMEREVNDRPAGFRTHILVTLGSTLIMLLSTQGFNDLESSGDPARLAAQVVSGIGFLGAGTILRNGNNIKGLTTAASLWVCGGIGLAIGSGYYIGGLSTAAIVLFCLMGLSVFERKIFKKKYKMLILLCHDRTGLIGDVGQVIDKYDISIGDIQILRNFDEAPNEKYKPLDSLDEAVNLIEVHFAVKLCKTIKIKELINEVCQIHGIQKVVWND